jgi:cytoskeletal protein CcmA (bactofilin family)
MDTQFKHRTATTDKGSPRRDEDGNPDGNKEGETAAVTTTVVGPSIVIRGRLKCSEDLVIKGRVDAEITSSKSLHIENSGIVKANIFVQDVTVNGVLVGNITAQRRTEIAADGRVVGDIVTPKLVIRDGASIRGRIDMPNFDAATTGVPASTETSPARASTRSLPAQPEMTGGAYPEAAALTDTGIATSEEPATPSQGDDPAANRRARGAGARAQTGRA